MNGYVVACHVREDRGAAAVECCKALATSGFRVRDSEIAPRSLLGGSEVGALKEAVQEGLTECCYVILLLTRAFLARPWEHEDLNDWVDEEVSWSNRVFVACWGVSATEVGSVSASLRVCCHEGSAKTNESVVREFSRWIEPDLAPDERMAAAGIHSRLAALVGCAHCDDHPHLQVEAVTAPPSGASGLLACDKCGAAYAIRGSIPQLRGESVILVSYPPSDW